MKIVNYEDFCKMPAGTIFAPYTPCVLKERLSIKVDGGYDVYCGPPALMPGEKFNRNTAEKSHLFNGVMTLEPWLGSECMLFDIGDCDEASFEIYDGDNNDYMKYKMFLVFEENDIDRLISVLRWAKDGCVGEPY